MPEQKPPLRSHNLENAAGMSWDDTTDEDMPAGLLEYLSERGLDPNSGRLTGAVKQAQQIQIMKDVQPIFLERLQELMDFPRNPTTTASAPSEEDATDFKKALIYFQPPEFDDLIWERNTLNRCGYALCPQQNRKLSTNATNHYTFHKKGGYTAVPKAQYEKWCSDQCAERAMYIRLQLVEWPLWTRDFQTGLKSFKILLLEEGRSITKTPQHTEDAPKKDTTDLIPDDTVVRIVENDAVGDVSAPSMQPGCSTGDIEGYTPK